MIIRLVYIKSSPYYFFIIAKTTQIKTSPYNGFFSLIVAAKYIQKAVHKTITLKILSDTEIFPFSTPTLFKKIETFKIVAAVTHHE